MGAYKYRTDVLLPVYSTTLKKWGMSKRGSRVVCGLTSINEPDYYRILNSEPATPEEVRSVSVALYEHGKKYNLPGWEELEHG